MLLGSAYYAQDDLNRAIAEWKRSLEIHDDARLREALEKAEKEQSVAGSYLEFRSDHFLVRYEGRDTEGLVRDLVNTLEIAFRDLSNELDYNPHETIIVLLYPTRRFATSRARPHGWARSTTERSACPFPGFPP